MTTSPAEFDASPDALSASDIEQIAAMHCEILPESLVSRIGGRYAESFYRYVARSELEHVFLHRDAGAVVSACIVSLEPHTLQRRLLFGTALVPRAALAIRRLPLRSMARAFGSRLARREPAANVQPEGPEVLLIFTLASARSSGLGATTIARTEAFLRDRGHERYVVKTADDPSNRAIAFYERIGFSRLGSVVKNGKPLVVFAKAPSP